MSYPIAGILGEGEYVAEVAATWGTTPVNPDFKFLGKIHVSITPTREVIEEYHLKDVGATQHRILDALVASKEECKFSFKYHPHDNAAGYNWTDFLNNHVFGGAAGVGDAPLPFTLYIKLSDPAGTLHYRLVGCMAESHQVSASQGGMVDCEASGICKQVLTTAPTMGGGSHATSPASAPLAWTNVVVAGALSGEFTNLLKFDVTFKNEVHSEHRMRSTNPELPAFAVPGRFHISGKVTIDHLNQAELTRMLASTAQSLVATIGTPNLTITGTKWDSYGVTIEPDRIIPIDLDFKGIDCTIS